MIIYVNFVGVVVGKIYDIQFDAWVVIDTWLRLLSAWYGSLIEGVMIFRMSQMSEICSNFQFHNQTSQYKQFS